MTRQLTIPAAMLKNRDWKNMEAGELEQLAAAGNRKGAAGGRAHGRRPSNSLVGYDASRMNRLEARYAGHLEMRKREGEICFWRFEQVKFRLADKTWYTPDFYIMLADGSLEIHETKGWMEDDANVKIKTVAELFPELQFVLVKWEKGQWVFRKYKEQK